MPKKGKVTVKKVERKAELDEAKKRKRGDEEPEKVRETETPSSKRNRIAEENLQSWNANRPSFKLVKTALAVPVLTENVMAEKFGEEYSLENVVSLLKDRFVFGKIRGVKCSPEDLMKKKHFSFPVYVDLDDTVGNAKGTPAQVYKVRLGINTARSIQKPSQYEMKKEDLKGKSKKEIAEMEKKSAYRAWNTNVPILDENLRDSFNCKVNEALYKALIDDVITDKSFWEELGRGNLCPPRLEATKEFKSPLVDSDEGSFFRIKFTYQFGSMHRKFEIFDFRSESNPKGLKNPPIIPSPSLINSFEKIDGTFEVDDVYVRPEDYAFGYGLTWCAARVYDADDGEVEKEDDLYHSSRIGQFEESITQPKHDDEEEEEEEEEIDQEDEEEEEEEKK